MAVVSDIVSYVITNDAVLRETQIENFVLYFSGSNATITLKKYFCGMCFIFLVNLAIQKNKNAAFFYA
jgi:hypothetical protein